MKKQKFYGVTFYFENGSKSYGTKEVYGYSRNVLADFLRKRFGLFSESESYLRQPTDKQTAERFSERFPTIKAIKILQVRSFQVPKEFMTNEYYTMILTGISSNETI